MTTAIAIPLSEPTMATARMSKQMRLDLGPPALTIRDVDPDAIDLVLKSSTCNHHNKKKPPAPPAPRPPAL